MEKKLKISEFAELIGVTAKTAYKMESRGEITTVSEKVNNRLTTLVITNDDQIKQFRLIYSKSPFGNGNCEDMLTDNYETLNNHDSSQSASNNELIQDMFERIITINDEYNNRIAKLNDELITTKAQVLLIEDKKNVAEGDKNHWQKEYFKLDEENKTLNKKLEKSNKTLSLFITVSITLLFTFIGALLTYNITKEQPPVVEKKQEVVETPMKQIQTTKNIKNYKK